MRTELQALPPMRVVQRRCPRERYRRRANVIGARMRELGMTEAELATILGVAQPYVNRVKNRRVIPSVAVAAMFARALGTSIDDLFFPDGLPPLPEITIE